MRLIYKNVEREAEGAEAEKLQKAGFKTIGDPETETVTQQKVDTVENLENMTVDELKNVAKEKGLTGISSLSKADLLAILKG